MGEAKEPDIQSVNEARSMPTPLVNEHNIKTYNFDAQEEVGEDECVRDEAMNTDSHIGGTSDKKKVRGQTKCMLIHARNLQEREEVTFYKGQAVGPTGKRVSQLSNFIGIIARNARFITLLFISWHSSSIYYNGLIWGCYDVLPNSYNMLFVITPPA